MSDLTVSSRLLPRYDRSYGPFAFLVTDPRAVLRGAMGTTWNMEDLWDFINTHAGGGYTKLGIALPMRTMSEVFNTTLFEMLSWLAVSRKATVNLTLHLPKQSGGEPYAEPVKLPVTDRIDGYRQLDLTIATRDYFDIIRGQGDQPWRKFLCDTYGFEADAAYQLDNPYDLLDSVLRPQPHRPFQRLVVIDDARQPFKPLTRCYEFGS